MPSTSAKPAEPSTPKEALRTLATVNSYLETLAAGAEVPVTPADLAKAIADFRATLVDAQTAANALVLAVLRDEPCPQTLFQPWASTAAIYQWRNAATDPLPTVELNGKVCIKPTEFFAALKRHGAKRAAAA